MPRWVWTRRRRIIRDALRAGVAADDIMKMVRAQQKGFRPSEQAMAFLAWEQDLKNVMARMARMARRGRKAGAA